jgi:hypothetical protein
MSYYIIPMHQYLYMYSTRREVESIAKAHFWESRLDLDVINRRGSVGSIIF